MPTLNRSRRQRCPWAEGNERLAAYHDLEWGVPVKDDRVWFEFLTLEGAQAGLSWDTILRKREHYRIAFAGFDPRRIARYGPRQVHALMRNPGIVRNRLKIESFVANARAFIAVQNEFGSFNTYIWRYTEGKPIRNRWRTQIEVPAATPLSERISKELRKRGFRFVGSSICYALLQATGMVNDHLITCFRHRAVSR